MEGGLGKVGVMVLSLGVLSSAFSQSRFSEEGGVKVYIWGEVKTPGVYRLHGTPDLVELISTAGGPTEQADLGRVRVLRGVKPEELRINLFRSVQQGEVFFLMPGDVVVVPRSHWDRVRELLGVLANLAVFVNLYIALQGIL